MEDQVDAILAQYCFEDFDLPLEVNPAFTSFDPVPGPMPISTLLAPPSEHYLNLTTAAHMATANSSHFAALKTDSEVEQAKASSIPENTRKNTSWAVNVWKEWSAHR